VLAALGFAWGEARFWPAAIEALEKALAAAKGDCPLRAVEQLANFRARHAAEDWLARREREPAAGGEADAAHADAMKRALADLELLCRRAPTSERWNLLGSAWKRQALMAADAEGRRAALKASAEAYDAAFAAGERRDAYAFTNWASAVLLARQLGLETGQALDPGALDADIARLHGALQAREAHDPDFWNRAALADLELVRLLARCAPSTAAQPRRRKPGRPPSLDAECEALAERIAEAYASAIRRGASPREQASVSENLDCLLVLLGTEGGALGEALRRIRAAVPHARTDRTAPAAGTVGAHPCAR